MSITWSWMKGRVCDAIAGCHTCRCVCDGASCTATDNELLHPRQSKRSAKAQCYVATETRWT